MDAVIRDLAARVDTTAVCDIARDTRVMSGALRCRSAQPAICGPAVTVRCRDDILGMIQAIEQAQAGDVIVVDGGGRETALAGELFTRAAWTKGLGGIIVDGGYRDLAYVRTSPLAIYSRHISPMAGTTLRPAVINEPVVCGGVSVAPGDVVFADLDGIVVLDPAIAEAQLTAAAAVRSTEERVIRRLDGGEPLSAVLSVREHLDSLRRGEPSSLRFTV